MKYFQSMKIKNVVRRIKGFPGINLLSPLIELVNFVGYTCNVLLLKIKLGQGGLLRNKNILFSRNTCFILGSGGSINSLTESNWEDVKSQTSIGINSWILHRFVPSILIFECGRSPAYNALFFKNIKKREKEYQDTMLFWKDAGRAIHGNHYLDFNGPAKNLFFPLIYKPCLLREGATPKDTSLFGVVQFFLHKLGIPVFHYSRATVVLAIDVAVRLGFKKIVLCGVDLTSTKYFWEIDNQKEIICENVELPSNTGQEGQAIHSTIDPSVYPLTVDNVIYNLNEKYLKPLDVNLFVGSEKSALFPRLPCYHW